MISAERGGVVLGILAESLIPLTGDTGPGLLPPEGLSRQLVRNHCGASKH